MAGDLGNAGDVPARVVADAVGRALDEDLLPLGDLSAALLPEGARARAEFVVRTDGVVAGTACATEAFRQVDPSVEVAWQVRDGDRVTARQVLGVVTGPLAPVLTAERTALNFLGHLSGIATRTRAFVDAAAPLRVWDTRKTTPGLRTLEKAAVRAGGARNHRGNLSDWVMFKDNHLTALGIGPAVASARDRWPGRTVHVECERLEQVQAALEAGADALLLDNMTPDEVRACVAAAEDHAASAGTRRALLEVSGGITLETVGSYAGTGADVVSSGSLTNSAPVLDIGLDIEVG
ncbi:MAG: carboxylating nicotinate-nucleotide diphosphorylase [Acidimicrobiales bacterium]